MEATDCDRATAQKALEACGRHCKTAIVMVLGGLKRRRGAVAAGEKQRLYPQGAQQHLSTDRQVTGNGKNNERDDKRGSSPTWAAPRNVAQAGNCVTRLRLTLRDESLADSAAIRQIDGVMGVIVSDEQFQVVLGPARRKPPPK